MVTCVVGNSIIFVGSFYTIFGMGIFPRLNVFDRVCEFERMIGIIERTFSLVA